MCDGRVATIVGTDGNDRLFGTDGNDVIVGLDGNDVIRAFGGNDVICGDNGRDRLFGGPGNDTLLGGKKNDILKGDGGRDHLMGNQGRDRLIGGGGVDTLEGGSGFPERLVGKGGVDTCTDPQPQTIYETCEIPPRPDPDPGPVDVEADFNGDGYSDLAIGVPREDLGDIDDAGAVHVIYGSADGSDTSNPLQTQFWTQDSPGVADSVEPDDRFGGALATGDFDDDGFDDLAIAAALEFIDGARTGAVHVLHGSSDGLSTTAGGGAQFWTLPSLGLLVDDFGGFGQFLDTGDFNNDDYDDLVIGHTAADVSVSASGLVHIIYGSSLSLAARPTPPQFWSQNSPGMVDEAEAQDAFGGRFATGDFNRDGYDDLAVGVPSEGEPFILLPTRAMKACSSWAASWPPSVNPKASGD